MPAGRLGSAYAERLRSFSWDIFYSHFGGSAFIEELKNALRRHYDYVLIDSRTGVSDVAGICTIQMPDTLVVSFTHNRQSIEGTARVVEAVERQSAGSSTGESRIRIYPIPSRVELAEKERLDAARARVRQQFSGVLWHLGETELQHYWQSVEILSVSFLLIRRKSSVRSETVPEHLVRCLPN